MNPDQTPLQAQDNQEKHQNKCYGDSIYKKINNEQRICLLNMVKEEGKSLKDASNLLGINYSTAKTILRVYRLEKRILKKSPQLHRDRINKKKYCTLEEENSSGLEVNSRLSTSNNKQTWNTLPAEVNNIPQFPSEYMAQLKGLVEMTRICIRQVMSNETMISKIKLKLNELGLRDYLKQNVSNFLKSNVKKEGKSES